MEREELIGSITECYLCDYCLDGDNSVYADCNNSCIKKLRNGIVTKTRTQYDENQPDLQNLPVCEVLDFETNKTSIILDEDISIVSSVK